MESSAIERESGLTESRASERLRLEGPNELPQRRRSSSLAVVFDVAREPMFLLLVACGVVYLAMGEPKEALMLLSFVFFIMGVTIIQERRTERALDALRDLSSPRALVIRDGQQKRIPGREVVRGDLLFLAEGDRVPADAILRHAVNLSADESLLTGESVPVRKATSATCQAMDRPGGDDLPSVFSGSMITRGQGVAEVLATGVKTEIGKIGKALQVLEPERTRLQKETGRLVRNLAIAGLSLCAVMVVLYGLTRGNTALAWKEALLAGITMAMAILPEEFPVVLTIFLALGAWPLILLPVHILFLELIIDPSCTLIFEAEEAEPTAMSRPPRSSSERLFGLKSLAVSLLQGFGALAAVLAVFLVARAVGHGADGARGLTFSALVAANLALILTNRSWSRTALWMFRVPNTALWLVLSGAAVFLSLVLWLPPLQSLFHFTPLPLKDILISLAAGAGTIAGFELFKVFRNHRNGGRVRQPDKKGVMS